jgi:Spy/CpxP family protein refolding chaperone
MIAVTSRRLAGLVAGLLLSCAALAQTAAPDAVPLSPMPPTPPHDPGMMGHGPGPGFGQGGPGGPRGMGPHHGGAFFLHGLKLSEAQRDKVFAIEYAQMPEAREQHKAIEHARRGLHQMVVSGQYDEARARTLAESLGRAVAREAQLRAQASAKIMQVLTPAQRKQVSEREAQRVAEFEPGENGLEPVPMM